MTDKNKKEKILSRHRLGRTTNCCGEMKNVLSFRDNGKIGIIGKTLILRQRRLDSIWKSSVQLPLQSNCRNILKYTEKSFEIRREKYSKASLVVFCLRNHSNSGARFSLCAVHFPYGRFPRHWIRIVSKDRHADDSVRVLCYEVNIRNVLHCVKGNIIMRPLKMLATSNKCSNLPSR